MSSDRNADSLEIVREIRASPERVFRALTDPRDLARWWTGIGGIRNAQFDLRPGGKYQYEFRMEGETTCVVHGEVREVDPPRRLVMTWLSPEYPTLETLLSFDLEPTAGGTRLTLRHSGLTEPGSCRDHHEVGSRRFRSCCPGSRCSPRRAREPRRTASAPIAAAPDIIPRGSARGPVAFADFKSAGVAVLPGRVGSTPTRFRHSRRLLHAYTVSV